MFRSMAAKCDGAVVSPCGALKAHFPFDPICCRYVKEGMEDKRRAKVARRGGTGDDDD